MLRKYSVTLIDNQSLPIRKRLFLHSVVEIRRCVEFLYSRGPPLSRLDDIWEICTANAPKCVPTSNQANHLSCAKTLIGEKSLVRFDVLFYDRNTKRPRLKSVYSATAKRDDGSITGSDSHCHANGNDVGTWSKSKACNRIRDGQRTHERRICWERSQNQRAFAPCRSPRSVQQGPSQPIQIFEYM